MKLKSLLRILFLLVIFLIGFFYLNLPANENSPLKGPTKTVPNTKVPEITGDASERPKAGWSTYIGKDVQTLKEKLGEPVRKGPSQYGFKWWVYSTDQQYMLVGVSKGKINQIYLTGTIADFAPFTLNQTLDELYRNTITDTEVNIKIGESIYTLVLSEDDLQSRLLVMYDGVFAQLYFDKMNKTLMGIRFIDGETLVKQQPYDMTYVGDMIETKKPSSFDQQKINNENATQLFELSNRFRKTVELESFIEDEDVNIATRQHLEGIVMESLANTSAPETALKKLLENNQIEFEDAAENIAEDYSDAADAMSGIINSDKHRKDLMNEKNTILGVAAFEKNYAQIFIEREIPTTEE
ncbi:hypothetical protein DF281_09030 [Kurthia zopfii]|nr:hypothetical protein DF281_09030 [Kurthia zopfii]